MIGWLRQTTYAAVFYAGSVPIVLMAPVAAIFGHAPLLRVVLLWVGYQALCARVVLGIRSRVEGDIGTGPMLYAVKHQSFYETCEMVRLLRGPAVVMRHEFARIPVWGWAARRYGIIVIDRAGSATALRQMIREGKAAKAAGRSVVIFPEGTRVPPGEAPPIKAGFAGLYRGLGMPVVPVALDSGRVWPKHGRKRPGIVTFLFGPPIAPGVERTDIEQQVHAGINRLEPSMIGTPEVGA